MLVSLLITSKRVRRLSGKYKKGIKGEAGFLLKMENTLVNSVRKVIKRQKEIRHER